MLIYTDLFDSKLQEPMLTAYAAAANGKEIAGETGSELLNLISLIAAKIPLWIAAFVVLIVAIVFAKIARNVVENKLADKIEDEHEEIQILGGRITYVAFLTIGVTVSLKIAGIDLTSIIAAGAFGIGFALKDLIMNFLAGIMILVGRHFSIGDFIDVGGTMGKVVEIQSRVTVLQATDGTKVIVPNADLFKNKVTSFTSNPFRRIEIVVSIDYRNNLENAMRVLVKILKSTKGILLQPAPGVVVDEFGDSAVNLKVRAWVESTSGWVKIKSNLIMKIKTTFDEYGIVMPYPISSIMYDKDQQFAEKMLEDDKITSDAVAEAMETGDAVTHPDEGTPALIHAPLPPVGTTPALAPATVTVTADAPIAQTVQMPEQPLKPLDEQRV